MLCAAASRSGSVTTSRASVLHSAQSSAAVPSSGKQVVLPRSTEVFIMNHWRWPGDVRTPRTAAVPH